MPDTPEDDLQRRIRRLHRNVWAAGILALAALAFAGLQAWRIHRLNQTVAEVGAAHNDLVSKLNKRLAAQAKGPGLLETVGGMVAGPAGQALGKALDGSAPSSGSPRAAERERMRSRRPRRR